MTVAGVVLAPASWVPDYLHGSLKHWQADQLPCACPRRHYDGDQVIHCVGRLQHLLDVGLGRAPRSRCGVRLVQSAPTALLQDGAPLCPACAAVAHPPVDQVEAFNHRGDSVRRL